MEIRLAEANDFEVYRRLYEDWDCNMLYRLEEAEVKPQTQGKTSFEIDAETFAMIEKEFKRTPEKFAKHISKAWYMDKRIYIIHKDEDVVGFAELFKCYGYRWKLEELCLGKGYQTQENFTEIIEKLIKMPYIKAIDVCILFDSCKKRLLEAGFKDIRGGFFRRKRK